MPERVHPSAVRTHHLAVTRTARYCTLGLEGPEVAELWLVCHGHGELAAGFVAGMGAIASPRRLIVAPEALSRFYLNDEGGPHGPDSPVGATWMTREDRLTEIEDYVRYLEALATGVAQRLESAPGRPPEAARVRRVALGFSQGTATVARWAARTALELDELILWGGRLPPELTPAAVAPAWQRTTVTLVAGSRDRWVRRATLEEEATKLAECGVSARVLTFEGGHRLDDGALRRLAGEEPEASAGEARPAGPPAASGAPGAEAGARPS